MLPSMLSHWFTHRIGACGFDVYSVSPEREAKSPCARRERYSNAP
jgi:hypothetical protein